MLSSLGMRYWLMKSEPDEFSIEDLKRKKESAWEGVRNFQARNFMKEMHVGDTVLFYHSSCPVPGVYGLARVSKEAAPDKTQFDKKSDYYDSRAKKDKPTWFCVSVSFKKMFKKPLTLEAMKADKQLKSMITLRPGNRLSVTPVSEKEFKHIISRTL